MFFCETLMQVGHLTAAAICSQSDLLTLSGLSADLDLLNELSRSLTLDDAAARRLQRLNRRWTDAAARAEEACRSETPAAPRSL